jgi:bidirectional [NiFe] hydrogenase diaphorase subunit
MAATTTDTAKSTPRAARGEPAGDNRMKLLDAAMKRHQYQPDALIEVLHRAQELFGYLSPALLTDVAQRLHLPPSRVYGVATFYHFFSLVPLGEHVCTVCMGTACYVKGGAAVLEAAEQAAGTRAGTTRPDGRASVLTARCLGACGIAPAVIYDSVVAGHQTPEAALTRVKGWFDDGAG